MNNELKNLYILSILPFLLFETIFAQAPVNRFDFANFFNKTKIESSNKSGTLNYFEYLLNSYGLHKPPLSDAVVNLSKSFSTPPYEQLGTTLPTFKSPVESFYENKNAIKGVQSFLKVGSDGIVGPTTEKAIKNFQSTNGLNPTGKVDDKTLQKIQEQMNAGSKSGENTSLGGSGKGDTIGLMQGTNFCTRTNGGPDGSGVSSCGTYTGDCKNLGKNVKAETKKLCSYCPDCQFIKGSCGTPMYFL
jgi:peptidoglycan hydrolase-like protein with peptidoglycan-binding domain